MTPRRNWISLFTEEELRRALGLRGTPESAAAVAAELYALPAEEQIHLDWLESTLLLLSCVSDAVSRRVLEHFTSSPEERAAMQREQERFREWAKAAGANVTPMEFALDDVVYDSRRDTGLSAAVASPAPRESFVSLFTEAELRKALELIGSSDDAAAVASALYSLGREEQASLRWTDLALGLLSIVSPDLAERVRATFGITPEHLGHVVETQDLFRMLVESGELRQGGMELTLQTVVR